MRLSFRQSLFFIKIFTLAKNMLSHKRQQLTAHFNNRPTTGHHKSIAFTYNYL